MRGLHARRTNFGRHDHSPLCRQAHRRTGRRPLRPVDRTLRGRADVGSALACLTCSDSHPMMQNPPAMPGMTIANIDIPAVAWHLGVRLHDFFRRWAFWLETEAGSSLTLAVNVRLDLRILFRARP